MDLSRKARAHTESRRRRTTVVQELTALIHSDPVLRMDLTRAIDDACKAGFVLGYRRIDELMDIVDYLMTYAPPFSEKSLVHCPLNAVLDWPMCMPLGYAFFRDKALNAQLKRVLNYWCGFLEGPHSRVHLTENAADGWLSAEADGHIGLSQFISDPDKPHWGFASWNAFFTRQFKDGARPVDAPNDSKIIVSACEAAPYNIQRGMKLHDRFWLKSQPLTARDVHGKGMRPCRALRRRRHLYQGFLSGFNYHRWHAPVNGTVTHAYLFDGSYYSDLEAEGADAGGLNDSQGYITSVAARAVVAIECDDAEIGTVACIFVGMADLSSCVIDALPGQRVHKGDELGYFQYGGSTWCLILQSGVVSSFVPEGPFTHKEKPVRVNTSIAVAR